MLVITENIMKHPVFIAKAVTDITVNKNVIRY